MLLQELIALQDAEGWLPAAGLREIAERRRVPLHRLESLSTFYTHFRRSPPKRVEIEVCRDLSCSLAGGEQACARLRERLADRSDVALHPVSCLGAATPRPPVRSATVWSISVTPRMSAVR